MKILVVGSGAREHALARHLALAGADLVIAPGNPGTAACGENRAVDANDPAAVAALAREIDAELVVVGPEAPLVAGVADAVRAVGIPVFGPDAAAARLEGSKAFAKDVMAAAEVPTALAHVCTTQAEVADALDAFGPPYVVKDDGLAAGKGVVVTDDREAALAHAADCLAKAVGAHVVNQVVIEEFLDGPEVSLFCLSDGVDVLPLAPAQDFKRIFDGDAGPNTGGMGAYTPLAWAPDDLTEQVLERVARPTVAELARRGTPFVGLLYCGLALTSRGLRVIEFNARFGDPETQVVLARLATPLDRALHAAATGSLEELGGLHWTDDAAVTVVLATPGYPEQARTGGAITGVEDAEAVDGAWVLHAGTALDDDGHLVAAGGRVLSVVGTGATLAEARAVAYDAAGRISLEGGQVRTDIALRAERGEVTVPGPQA
ncbi:phosphoribosylamine--glycine ligase [Serinibacter arcticus]|uniref:Phosphoribosylamine--glycine ligase n=1 Tax=Serinibacter arcticus TaxID=1655435 RepID=A0A4Z1E129_9MICO|nr:phosphoribosylamine--glycine ligase [Serinibacter arcticus]TGO05556.1 Phosphoribosylamine--glycine ligase [Serinibacter arcticus]